MGVFQLITRQQPGGPPVRSVRVVMIDKSMRWVKLEGATRSQSP